MLYHSEFFLDTMALQDETHKPRRYDYYILKDHLDLDGYSGESYGLKIEEKETGQVALVPHVTSQASDMDRLARRLMELQVTPCTLVDVIQDWL